MSTSYFSSSQLFQDFLGNFHSRKLFLENHLTQLQVIAAPPPEESRSLHKSVVMILISAVIISVGLNILILCALARCRRFTASESNANRSKSGVKKKSLKTFPLVKYSAELKLPGLDTECIICLSEFAAGERVRILPKCSHGFHVRCIDKWLKLHTSCPKCRQLLIQTCEEIMGLNQDSHSGTSVISIRPLEAEGIIRSYGGIS